MAETSAGGPPPVRRRAALRIGTRLAAIAGCAALLSGCAATTDLAGTAAQASAGAHQIQEARRTVAASALAAVAAAEEQHLAVTGTYADSLAALGTSAAQLGAPVAITTNSARTAYVAAARIERGPLLYRTSGSSATVERAQLRLPPGVAAPAP